MRIKTVPKHRILQNNVKIIAATINPSDDESVEDVEKNYNSNAMNGQDSYQVSDDRMLLSNFITILAYHSLSVNVTRVIENLLKTAYAYMDE
jgi:hypothetical protein